MINRTQQPAITDPIHLHLHLQPARHFILDNGISVYAVEAGAQEVVQLELVFQAGNWYDQKNIQAATTNFLLKNGTRHKTAFQLNEHFEMYGAYLNRGCYHERASLSVHSLTKYLPKLLPALAEIVSESVFPEEELNIYRQNQQQRLAVNLKKADFVANRLIDAYLFGEQHPYGKYSNPADYDALTREDLLQFYQQYYLKGHCTIFIAGQLPPNIEKLLNQFFGQLPLNGTTLAKPDFAIVPASQKKYAILNDANGVQAAIRLATAFPDRHHPDFLKAQLLNALFGGYFGSRLMSNIRENKGYTYGIHSFIQAHQQQSAWMVTTEAGRDVSRATIEETYKEMLALQKEPVSAEELSLIKNFMIGTLLGDVDGPFHIIERWKSYVLNEMPANYFYISIQTIKDTTAGELQVLAKKYLNPDDFYELEVI
ncbi:pitrilysin family protein [Hydrotalea sp.]|uniref:M16 family metallopeptidase n=1 Tax=Hydrotalea sp. TaxID=2881279 RepID=UPI00262000BA|nr:pitrilysin family protein [Hydrotalea sp.]